MEREDILNNIEEQERWSAQAFARVQEDKLFPASELSDAQFITRVRERIEKSRGTVVYRPKFLPLRKLVVIVPACVILLVAVFSAPQFLQLPEAEPMVAERVEPEPRASLMMRSLSPATPEMGDVAMMPTEVVVESLADADVDPVELAQYLDLPEFVEEDVADTSEDGPLTELLLALDAGTLEEVLNDLEDTEFF